MFDELGPVRPEGGKRAQRAAVVLEKKCPRLGLRQSRHAAEDAQDDGDKEGCGFAILYLQHDVGRVGVECGEEEFDPAKNGGPNRVVEGPERPMLAGCDEVQGLECIEGGDDGSALG